MVDTLLSPRDGTKAPTRSVSASPVDFGSVDQNDHQDMVVTVTNVGTSALVIKSKAASPAGLALQGAAFSVVHDVVSGATINPSASATITVRFAPTAAGDANGSVTLSSNVGNFPVTLTGTGVAAAAAGG